MKKIGIITYFGENYGACLQAYAVQETIRSLGYNPEIINYMPTYKESNVQMVKRRIKHVFKINRYIKYVQNKFIEIKYKGELVERSLKFQKFINFYLNITKTRYESFIDLREAQLDYECFITGSDQLWNPLHHKCNPVFFLDFVPEGKKRIAFAPSIAIRNIPEKYKKDMSKLIGKMDSVSVREDINVNTVKELVYNKEVFHALDPTFMLDKYEWDKIIGKPLYNEKYIFCYLFGDLKYIERFISHIRDVTGYKVVSMPYNIRELASNNIERLFNAGPSEFVNVIRNAELIITDSFHATAFSINYNKPFYTLLRQEDSNPDNMNSRFYSILKVVGLEERLILPDSKFPENNFTEVDFRRANEKLNMAKQSTLEYLERSLR